MGTLAAIATGFTAMTWPWVAWLGVGLLCGAFAGSIFAGPRIRLIDIALGVIGAGAGGAVCAQALSEPTPQTFIISMLAALFVAGALLWIAGRVYMTRIHDKGNKE